MFKNKKIAVVVPAYNEEKMIGKVIETMPSFVDAIIIVDDCSKDKTIAKAKEAGLRYKKRVEIVAVSRNQGVGNSIIEGYKKGLKLSMDVMAVMAGDAQMDPSELKSIVLPVIKKEADMVKGNRFFYGQAWRMIPKVRYLGNSILSLFTKIASGYWHVADSQTGYTALSKEIIKKLPLDDLYKRYGFENDLLVHLNVLRARIKEIAIKPIYYRDGKSGMRLWNIVPTISWILLKRFFWRLKHKYIIQDFHPLVFFYLLAILLSATSLYLFIRLIHRTLIYHNAPPINALAFVFCAVMASQFLFFAMWFDMDYNKNLKVD